MKTKEKKQQKFKRQQRVRAKILGTSQRPRLNVYRSLSHIYIQIINDVAGKTLVSASDLELKSKKKTKAEKAHEVGKLIAQKAEEAKINKVIFDRAGYKYHGRVKAVAEGAREGGLEF